MAINALKTFNASDEEVNRIQQNLTDFLNQIKGAAILDGQIVSNVTLGTSAVKIKHKLGRKITGYLVITKSANASIWDSLAIEKNPELYLTLTATAACNVTLWVF